VQGFGYTGWTPVPSNGKIPDADVIFGLIQWTTPGDYQVKLSVKDDLGQEDSAYLYMQINENGNNHPNANVYVQELVSGVGDYQAGTFLSGNNMIVEGTTEGCYGISAYHSLWPDTGDLDGELTTYKWSVQGIGDTGWTPVPPNGIPDADEIFGLIRWATPGLYEVKLSVVDDNGAASSAYLYMDIEECENEHPNAYVYALTTIGPSMYPPPEPIGDTFFGGNGFPIDNTPDKRYIFSAYKPFSHSGLDTHDPDGYLTEYRWEIEGIGDTGWQPIPPGGIPDTDEIFGLIQWTTPGQYEVKLHVKDDTQDIEIIEKRPGWATLIIDIQ
jgi:hypothetical protein